MSSDLDFAVEGVTGIQGLLRRLIFRVQPPDSSFANGSAPLIIGGCARSGTTLMLSALSAHPSITAIPHETQTFCRSWYYRTPGEPLKFRMSTLAAHFADCPIPAGTRYWCEKTPRNIQVFETLLRVFRRRVRLLQIVRDGRDVVCSVHPDDPNQFWVAPGRWIEDVKSGLPYLNHPQVMTVRYEDLVWRFKETMSAVYEFLGLTVQGVSLNYPEGVTLKSSNAWAVPASPVYTDSIGRWRQPEFHGRVQELITCSEAHQLLRIHGYDVD